MNLLPFSGTLSAIQLFPKRKKLGCKNTIKKTGQYEMGNCIWDIRVRCYEEHVEEHIRKLGKNMFLLQAQSNGFKSLTSMGCSYHIIE